VRLHEAAQGVRSRLRDSVATIAIMISAEMSAGASAEQAVQRAAELPGLLGSFLSDAVELSRSSGRPLIKRGNMPGTFSDVCAHSGLRELRVLASQLDLVADVGVDAADRMAEVAKSVLSEQKNAINDKVQQLEDKLAVMVGMFFFAPSWFALLGVIFFESMKSF
jgi:Flp pilus assembly protein TadB